MLLGKSIQQTFLSLEEKDELSKRYWKMVNLILRDNNMFFDVPVNTHADDKQSEKPSSTVDVSTFFTM